MKLIKKSFKVLKENFWILFGIELIFFLSAFLFISFLVKKIAFHVEIINSLMPELEAIREVMAENVDKFDFVNFNALRGLVVENISKIILIAALLVFDFYLLWCFFQSTSWRLCYIAVKKKLRLKSFFKYLSWGYFLKFSLLSLVFLFLISLLLFQIIIKSKGFILNSLISRLNLSEHFLNTGSIKGLAILIPILLFLIYFLNLIYILLNENHVFKTVKKFFLVGIKGFYLFFIVLLCLSISFALLFLVRINLFLSFGLIFIFYIYFKILMNILVRR